MFGSADMKRHLLLHTRTVLYQSSQGYYRRYGYSADRLVCAAIFDLRIENSGTAV